MDAAGIQHIVTPPYTPMQNGMAERMNRTLMESARCILEDSQLGKEFWGHAVLTAAHIHNRLRSHSYQDKSPIEHWTGKIPGIGHLRVFGSMTWVHVPSEKRQKLDPKSARCMLVGYEEDARLRVYRLFDQAERRVILSRYVIIDESSPRRYDIQDLSNTATIIEWDKDASTTQPEKEVVEQNQFMPLDTIVPPSSPTTEEAGIQDSITVRPRLATKPTSNAGPSKVPSVNT